MATTEIQIVSNEEGEPVAVIVPIDLWREIESKAGNSLLAQVRADEGSTPGRKRASGWNSARGRH
jgi:antitoxin (DNA-binding transcriptional repressor) of toxin-antitoxin stability system